MQVVKRDGSREAFDISKIQRLSEFACSGLNVSQSELESSMVIKFFDGMKTSDIHDAQIAAAAELISRKSPDYTYTAARLLLMKVNKEVNGEAGYPHLRDTIARGIKSSTINPQLANFDLDALNACIMPERDLQFDYLGMQTIADRYLLREMAGPGKKGALVEMPQHMFMRIAMGLALRDVNDGTPADSDHITRDVIDFYNVLSSFDFMSSTPTLFNSGTKHSQLSSCYLSTVADALTDEDNNGGPRHASIFGTINESANLSKWAGGIGTDWTRVRPQGSVIKGTNGLSAGVIPYLKVWNDTANAVNQGGKRKGSFAPYMETWHPDFMKYTELKKNTGDERLRAHDIFPAAWISDLFMKRVERATDMLRRGIDPSGVLWSFFDPSTYPELHELWGEAFEERYAELESVGAYVFQLPVMEVWKKMITMLFETGHPWMTFKDTCNRRSPQQHCGVVHNSNLCTEITLNTSDEETAVCNLGSVNLRNHIRIIDGKPHIDYAKLRSTVRTAIRMLDNVIDINFYPSWRAEASNLRHRPIGLGMMGLSDAMTLMGVSWSSQEGLEFQDQITEAWSYYAIEASSDLAAERGKYQSYEGSLWSQGILPIDTASDEAEMLTVFSPLMDWDGLRRKIAKQGMRNSNVMAVAPTATIANIAGVTPSIEPPFEREYLKENLSGQFWVIAPATLLGDCETAFDIKPTVILDAAAVRGKWIDQAQSTNVFAPASIRGSELGDLYMQAWKKGLKTTYYLRRLIIEHAAEEAVAQPAEEVKLCSIDNPDCESCQ